MSIPIPTTFNFSYDGVSSCDTFNYTSNVSGSRLIIWKDCNNQDRSLTIGGFATGSVVASNTPTAPNGGVGFSEVGAYETFRTYTISWDGNVGENAVVGWYDKNGQYCERLILGVEGTSPTFTSVCSLPSPWKVSSAIGRNFVVNSGPTC